MNQIFLETRMFRLSDGEEIMTLAFFVLIQYRSVTDGQTDGHLCFGYTSACIACYANALVKIYVAHCEDRDRMAGEASDSEAPRPISSRTIMLIISYVEFIVPPLQKYRPWVHYSVRKRQKRHD